MKTANKTATSPRNGSKIPLGAHPGNTGGKPGRSGRPPEEYRRWLQGIVESVACRQAVARVLANPDHPAFPKLYGLASERLYGKPMQEIQTSGEVTVRVVYDG